MMDATQRYEIFTKFSRTWLALEPKQHHSYHDQSRDIVLEAPGSAVTTPDIFVSLAPTEGQHTTAERKGE